VGEAALDVAMSMVGVMSPVPGAGQALKTLKVADKVIDGARAAEHASLAKKAAGGCCCFPAGTPVLTAGGMVPIEDIRVGDSVYARDPDTGHTALKPVTQLIHTEGKPLYALTLRDKAGQLTDMEVTDNHPYRVRGAGWVDAAQLRPGMEVESFDRSALTVVVLKPAGRVELTYNFTVGDYHTYFAGHAKAFVHNCSCLAKGLAGSVTWKGFSKGKLAEHFEKHGAEFGNITQSEYLKQAKAFSGEAGNFLEQQVGNFVVKHDPATRRTFIGHSNSREIRTFYKADGRDADPFQAAVDLARKLGS
jgi:hypothetical protein